MKLTLNEWFDTWIETYKRGKVKDTTIDTYRSVYDRHIREGIGKYMLGDISALDIQQFYKVFLSMGHSCKYLNTLHTMLNSCLKSASNLSYIESNPCETTDRPKGVSSERRVLSFDEQRRLQMHIKSPEYTHIEPLITTLLGTGLRIGEILGLMWSDISSSDDGWTLDIKRTLVRVKCSPDDCFHYALQAPKTKCSIRTIPLQSTVVSALNRQHRLQEQYRQRDDWEPPVGFEDLVFSGKKGQPQWRSTIVSCIDNIVNKMNEDEREYALTAGHPPMICEKIRPHALRHTFATRSLEAGIPPKVVQTWLGHASIRMTLDLYTHVSPDISSDQMKKLEEYLG